MAHLRDRGICEWIPRFLPHVSQVLKFFGLNFLLFYEFSFPKKTQHIVVHFQALDQAALFSIVTKLQEVKVDSPNVAESSRNKISKHLYECPEGNSEFCLPDTLNAPWGEAEGNIEG